MSYAKAMKWQRTHRKGIPNLYMGFDTGIKHEEPIFTPEQYKELEIISFESILNPDIPHEYPIYIAVSRHYWFVANERNLFGNKINTHDELMSFYNDYIIQ